MNLDNLPPSLGGGDPDDGLEMSMIRPHVEALPDRKLGIRCQRAAFIRRPGFVTRCLGHLRTRVGAVVYPLAGGARLWDFKALYEPISSKGCRRGREDRSSLSHGLDGNAEDA